MAQILFIESVCSQPKLIRALMRDTWTRNPDYADVSQDAAIEQMELKVQHLQVRAIITRRALRV
jgi:hypothetical protein